MMWLRNAKIQLRSSDKRTAEVWSSLNSATKTCTRGTTRNVVVSKVELCVGDAIGVADALTRDDETPAVTDDGEVRETTAREVEMREGRMEVPVSIKECRGDDPVMIL